jgi:hypothetical protein
MIMAIDQSVLKSVENIFENDASEVIQVFLAEGLQLISKIEEGVGMLSQNRVHLAVYTLSASAKTMGATHIYTLALQITDCCRVRDFATIKCLLPQLKAEFFDVEEEFRLSGYF